MLETIAAIGGALGGLGQAAGGAAGLFGGGSNNSGYWQQLGLMREQAQLQREFAQQGIQWRVADAKAAGIHPLYALGGSGASYSPSAVSVGTGGASDLGRDLGNMGQGIGRALTAVSSKEDRDKVSYDAQVRRLNLERLGLENANLASQLEASRIALNRAQVGPPMPTGPSASVQVGDPTVVGRYDPKSPEVENTNPSNESVTAGPANPGVRYVQLVPGYYTPLPSKELNMDDFGSPGSATYHAATTFMPMVSRSARDWHRPPKSMLPKGYDHWQWTPLGYRPRRYVSTLEYIQGKGR